MNGNWPTVRHTIVLSTPDRIYTYHIWICHVNTKACIRMHVYIVSWGCTLGKHRCTSVNVAGNLEFLVMLLEPSHPQVTVQ